MADLPTGTVTFLFTDIEGSTRLAQQHPASWEAARRRHHAILRAACEAHHGYIFQIVGDAFCAAFQTANDGLLAALAAQRSLQREDWGALPVRVRMGLHTGAAAWHNGEYEGYLTLARVQRIMSAGHGGQVLMSLVIAELVRDNLPSGVTLSDLGEHRLKSLHHTERLFQLVATGLEHEFPPIASLSARPNNLPLQLTSFIGREREIAEVKRLLENTRLLTFTGSGGTGKTRLSLQVAADLLDQFPDGGWLVELAPLSDPAFVPQTVASALDIREDPGRPIMLTLADYLHDKHLLLILDNCEHLIAACAGFADSMLHAAPLLKIVASSREALGIAGEATYHVPSLPVPNPKAAVSAMDLTHYDAVRLFVERAVAARSNFALSDGNAMAVAQICTRLDGIPLAIELAAARIKALPPDQIASRLDDRFRLLTGGSRTALPRQQTLRALIDWSYGLLSEAERVLLRRLSVFAGGWSFDAAEAVCTGDGIETEDVLDLLARLVEKSLAVVDEAMDEPRYRMLETVRQYAREKLLDSGEAEAVRTEHLRHYSTFTAKATSQLHKANEEVWFSRIEGEHDNVRVAIDWSLHGGDEAQGATMVSDLWWFWYVHGYYDEAMEHFAEFLRRPLLQPRSAGRARLLNALGVFQALGPDNWEAAREHFAEAYAIGHEWGDLPVMGMSLAFLPWGCTDKDDLTEAQRKAEECVAIWRTCGDDWFLSWAIFGAAYVAYLQHDVEQALALFEESAAILRSIHEKALLAGILRQLAFIALEMNEVKRADELNRESLQLNIEMREWQGAAGCLACEAAIALAQADNERAVRLMGATQKLVESLSGLVLYTRDLQVFKQNMASLNQQIDSEAFAKAWATGLALTREQAIQLALKEGDG